MSAADASMGVCPGPSLRDQHRYLDDDQWDALKKLEAFNGTEAVEDLLNQDPEVVVARIMLRGYEIALEKYVVDVVSSQVAPAKISAPPPTVTYLQPPAPPTPSAAPKPLHASVSSFGAEDGENLVFWARENEIAMAAARIVDEQQKIAFGLSNLKGRVKTWALTCETTHPGYFSSWDGMVRQLKEVFLPPNVAHRQRAAFRACHQGDREIHVYVQELRPLVATMAANVLAEDVKLATFMENMKAGPTKAAVFCGECTTLEEAFTIALREDYIQRISRGLSANSSAPVPSAPMTSTTPSAEPMDLSTIDLSGVDLSTFDLSAIDVNAFDVKCFTCGKYSHYQRDCPRNRGQRFNHRSRRGHGRGRGRGRPQAGRGDYPDASQGNVHSQ